jgi:hypothetical protein
MGYMTQKKTPNRASDQGMLDTDASQPMPASFVARRRESDDDSPATELIGAAIITSLF